MKLNICFSIYLAIILWSCGQPTIEKNKTNKNDASENNSHHHNYNETIELNNGEKWVVDDNMMVHIMNIEKNVKDFNGSKLTEYHQLAKKINTNLDLLTSNCTMKGKAHDELHKWLLPFIDIANNLAKTEDDKAASSIFAEIQKSFITFHQYFQ